MRVFGEPYFASKRAITNYVAKLRKLIDITPIEVILPQHGSIIDSKMNQNIAKYINALEVMEVGQWH